MEHDVQISELLSESGNAVGCQLDNESIQSFILYFNELCKWNKKVNLTAFTKTTDIVITLFIDSLACGLALNPEKNETIIDIGSGAGFPGIPLKIAYPGLDITLVEPRLKKAAFLHHIIGRLGLEKVQVLSRSIQELCRDPSENMAYDMVVAKAIKAESILPVAGSLLKSSGKAVLFRSKRMRQLEPTFGMKLVQEIEYELPRGYGKRVLSVLEPIR